VRTSPWRHERSSRFFPPAEPVVLNVRPKHSKLTESAPPGTIFSRVVPTKAVGRALVVLLAEAFLFCDLAFGLPSLRDQLALAEKDDDTNAQIELIRRILDTEPSDDELRGRLTELWISVEDYDMAESALRDWTNAPEATRKRVLAAALFHRDQKKDKAVALLEGYLAGHAEDVEITRQLAGYLDKMGSNKELVDLLDKAPGSEQEADLLLLRAVARRKLQDFPGAVRDFAAADKLSPEDSGIAANRPSFDRLRAALAGIEAANTLLARNPGDLRARLARSYWYLTTGSAGDLALEDARQAREADPGSVTALLLFAMASNQAGKLSAAQALETLQVDTSKPLPTPETLDRFQRCDARIAQQPKEVSLLLERGRELADNAQQYRLAARDAEEVLEINPRNVSARAAKIREFAKLGRSDDAAIELRVLETQNPPRGVLVGSLSEMADASFAASRLDAALEYVNRAIKLKPEAHYYKQRAAILQRLERFSEATSDLALARQMQKDGDR
jgi:tetratricopeptide (TPR) repeat protein